MPEITLPAAHHTLKAYIASPPGQGPWPGVVVIHDGLGYGDDVIRHVDWFAASGYIAIAPDMYSWGNKIICIRDTFKDMLSGDGAAFEDIEAARKFLTDRSDCTGKVGIIGFCMGGSFALLAASGKGFSASSVNYGRFPKDLEAALGGACPIIGSFGARDFTLPGAAAKLEDALQKCQIPHDVKEYKDVGHAFMNKHGGVVGWITDRVGMNFHEPSASDAQTRILSFFKKHLS